MAKDWALPQLQAELEILERHMHEVPKVKPLDLPWTFHRNEAEDDHSVPHPVPKEQPDSIGIPLTKVKPLALPVFERCYREGNDDLIDAATELQMPRWMAKE